MFLSFRLTTDYLTPSSLLSFSTLLTSMDFTVDPRFEMFILAYIPLISIVSFIFSLVAFYLLLTKTPKSSDRYKWYLMNLQVSELLEVISVSNICDIFFAVFSDLEYFIRCSFWYIICTSSPLSSYRGILQRITLCLSFPDAL